MAVKVGDKYNEISAEAGSKVNSGFQSRTTPLRVTNRIVIKINHATEAEGAYPIVLVSSRHRLPALQATPSRLEFAKVC